MTERANRIVAAMLLAGLVLCWWSVPRAEQLWTLVRCDADNANCVRRGPPLPYTACTTDMVGETNVAPKASRIRCVKSAEAESLPLLIVKVAQ